MYKRKEERRNGRKGGRRGKRQGKVGAREHLLLLQDPGSVPSIHKAPATTFNFSFRGSNALFSIHGHQTCTRCTDIHSDKTTTHTIILKCNKEKSIYKTAMAQNFYF